MMMKEGQDSMQTKKVWEGQQNKLQSFIESVFTVTSGFFIALIVQLLIFPLYDIDITLFQNIQIVMILTVTSIIRIYFIRRLFNNITDVEIEVHYE